MLKKDLINRRKSNQTCKKCFYIKKEINNNTIKNIRNLFRLKKNG